MLSLFRKDLNILLYTDSRGTNIPGQNNYNHYGVLLGKKYNVEKYLCPEKWTTTLDFLKLLKKKNVESYDLIILHTGIVDHSPRHQQIANNMIYTGKKDIFDEVFGEEIIKEYLKTDFGIDYEGDKTINMYSIEMAKKFLLPKLLDIPNILWISSNKIVLGWNGNYWKERPKNISIIEDYSNLFLRYLGPQKSIDLMRWNDEEVRKYTFDNMHPNKEGSNYIYKEILKNIQQRF